MPKGILGRKLGMTQVFDADGRAWAVTVVEAGPCPVVARRTVARDGYDAVQLGFGPARPRRLTRPLLGHFRRAGVEPHRLLREIRWGEGAPAEGEVVTCAIFQPGEFVDVTGRSRGKGFAGVVKRHGAGRGPMSHGSKYHRRVGSLGGSSFPSRVFKGKPMPGHMGAERVTVKNLQIFATDPERNLLLIRGAVPGPRGAALLIRAASPRHARGKR
ncbi:MAG: 50S ribosomal protein L3 [Clostridia bacterium]|nr:50S ribosomal protein L3 [Clostridia bacterium]